MEDNDNDTGDLITAAAAPVRGTRTAPPVLTAADVFRGLADPARRAEIAASLADVTHTGAGQNTKPAAWVGELWSGVSYQRRFVPLLGTPKELTSLKIAGWRWKVAPKGGAYAGDKAPIPTNPATTESQESVAERWAGGHDIDRAMLDFDNPGFWESYYLAMVNDYAEWSDNVAATQLLDVATDAGAASGPVSAIVKAAQGVITGKGIATVFGLAPDVFAALLELTSDQVPAWLSGAVTLNPMEGQAGGVSFAPLSGLPDGTVLAVDPRAADYYELGSTPVRADAPNVARGGVDVGLFGYAGVDVHLSSAIAVATVSAT